MGGEWYVQPEGEPTQGPLDGEAVRAMIARGEATPAARCWRQGLERWGTLAETEEFRDAFVVGPAPAAGEPASASETGEPQGEPGPEAASSTAADAGREDKRAGLGGRLQAGAVRAGHAVARVALGADFMVKLHLRRRDRERLLARVGEGVVAQGEAFLRTPDYEALAQQLRALDAEIANLQTEIGRLRALYSDTPPKAS